MDKEIKVGDHIEVRSSYDHSAANQRCWVNGYKVIEVDDDFVLAERTEGHFKGTRIQFMRDAVKLKEV